MKIKRFNKKIIISLLITLTLSYFLLRQTDYKNIFLLFEKINYGYVIISFIFYFLLTLIRALRIKLLLHNRINIKGLFATVLINNLIINILPFRIGELSLPILLKKYSKVPKKEGFLLLLYLRAIDALVILFFLFFVILFFSSNIIQLKSISYIFIFALLLFIFTLLFKGDTILSNIKNFSSKKGNSRIFNKIFKYTDSLLPVYKFYRNKTKKTLALSILIFITLIFAFGFILKAYPIDLNYIDVITISLIIIVTTSLPINGIAGIGILELGISSFLVSLGIDKSLSIGIAFNYHFIYLIFIIFFGNLSFFYLHNKE
ncbi:MAG: flippase-like domain-containing protein [Candidatus Pacebacteria bacterium]|nr:flippase-like domain-containing protein [Candidatus Paceibacterota bacterium]